MIPDYVYKSQNIFLATLVIQAETKCWTYEGMVGCICTDMGKT